MGREASAILKRSRIDLQLHIGYTREVFEVVNLRGSCDMEEVLPPIQGGPLGLAHELHHIAGETLRHGHDVIRNRLPGSR